MGLFDKLFGKKKKATGFDTPIDQIKKEREDYRSLGKNIYPVVKATDDPRVTMSENTNPLVTKKLSDGFLQSFSLDLGDRYEMVSEKLLEQTKLTAEQIEEVAMRNLLDKFNGNCKFAVMDLKAMKISEQAKPFYALDFDINFNPSAMLIDEFWEHEIVKQYVNSNRMAVSIPSKSDIFFSDMRIMESFRTMRAYSTAVYKKAAEEGLQLSKDTYIRIDNQWVKFLDTDEQWEAIF